MKKKILTTLLILTMALSAIPVYAEEPEDEVMEDIAEEEEPEIPETGESIADSIRQEAEEIGISGNETDVKTVTSTEYEFDDTGDGMDGETIDVIDLASSEINNCQLTINASLPEGFDANCYVLLQNDKMGAIYNFPLYAKNNFSQRGYVPEGLYHVNEIGVYDDIDGVFIFNKVDDFELSYGEVKGITVSLENEQEAIDLIATRTMEEQEEETQAKGYKFTNSDYEFEHTGTGTGHISVQGIPSDDYKFVIKILKGGIPGNMTIAYSTDDGKTYSDPVDVELSGKWEFDDMTYYFEVPAVENDNGTVTYGTFADSDTYRCVYFDISEDFVYESSDRISIRIHDNDPEKNPFKSAKEQGLKSIEIEILKAGPEGMAVYRYRINGGDWSEQATVSEDLTFGIPDSSLYVEFTADSSGVFDFQEGSTFTATVPEPPKFNPIILMIAVIAMILTGAYLAVVWYFKKQIIPQSVYTIHEYTPVRRNKTVKKDDGNKKRRKER